MISHLHVCRCKTFVDLRATQADIIGTEEREGFSWGAITPRAPDFLVIRLDRFGQISMRNPTNIRLVDTQYPACRYPFRRPPLPLQ